MQYQRQSSAYDLSAFETKQSQVVKPNLQVIKKSKKSNQYKALVGFSQIMLGGFVVAMLAAILYSNAIINELGIEVSNATAQYNQLINESKKLNADLESKVSLRNVEKYAKENLGLSKMEAYQIEYINMLPEDKIEYIQREDDAEVTDKILNALGKFVTPEQQENK